MSRKLILTVFSVLLLSCALKSQNVQIYPWSWTYAGNPIVTAKSRFIYEKSPINPTVLPFKK